MLLFNAKSVFFLTNTWKWCVLFYDKLLLDYNGA